MVSEPVVVLLFRCCVLAYLLGAALGLVWMRRQKVAVVLGFLSSCLGGLAGLATSGLCLHQKISPTLDLLPLTTSLFPLRVYLDPLSAFFVLVISLAALAVSLYSIGYCAHYRRNKNIGSLVGFLNLLLLANTLVFCASHTVFFLVAWEAMALTAFALVSFEHQEPKTRQAGALFFVMSHIGTGCLVLGYLLLYRVAGTFRFEDLHLVGQGLSEPERSAAFFLFLVGFGVKAGLIPLHVWLPEAHPVAPSNVSALMSGVLLKSGIYGLLRVLLDFLGAPPPWWGITLLVLGSASALLGVLYALVQKELKRLLAFSSLENIGIILIGIGAALMLSSFGKPVLAAMALVAALYHTLNHACFKGLLFLGAGAVLSNTGTQDLEKLGGLIRPMPKTALLFLLGSLALCGFPPLNGFVSEWLTYQVLLSGFGATERLVRLNFPIAGALLALTGALAAVCFVKALGIAFLALPRTAQAAQAEEASTPMLLGMSVLGGACIVLGLFPQSVLRLMDPIVEQLLGTEISPHLIAGHGWILTASEVSRGSISTVSVLLLFLGLLPVPAILWRLSSRKAKSVVDETWDCGLDRLTPQMQYTGTAYSKPLQMIFRAIYRPRRQVQADFTVSRYFTQSIRFESQIEPTFERWLYQPLNRMVLRFARQVRRLQMGSLSAYLSYIFFTLLVLLLWERTR
ncbi:MAG: hydrogenase 4 subunit B [Acidobacteriota bacterium]